MFGFLVSKTLGIKSYLPNLVQHSEAAILHIYVPDALYFIRSNLSSTEYASLRIHANNDCMLRSLCFLIFSQRSTQSRDCPTRTSTSY